MPLQHRQKLYNCAVAIQNGRILAVIPKKNLPNYSEFYEQRHFAAGPDANDTIELAGEKVPFGSRILLACKELPALRIGVEICEDLWVASPPSIDHAQAGATLIVNLSASDETVGKLEYRRSLVQGQSARLVCAYI